ncbi:MAG: response regulator, partial [Chitinispirillaceae bacterium]|nr:response regulator [Chitinispirillaceae bacterium]
YNAAYSLTYQEGLEYIDKHPDIDIVLLDVNLRSELSGIEVLPLIKEKNKYVQVIMFTSYDRLDVGLECMKRGAMDFMTKPFDEKHFLRVASIALEKKRLEQIKDLYFDMVVHDLKNPLQCICGSFEMLHEQLKETLAPIQLRLFETAESGIHQIQLIIGNILGITSFEKGSLIARRESFAVAEAVHETTTLYDSIEVKLSDALPVTIRSDRDLYIRILTNIISNALRFATVGSTVPVFIDYDAGNRFLTTSVMNRGSYIDEKHREVIFSKFIGVQRSIGSLRGQNFGLGLTFSRMAIEALEGAIWVESNKDTQETTFKFKIKDFTVV